MSTEDILTETLAERADATPYDATPLAAVAGRARRIRRRRRTVVGAAAAAAVLAIVLPVAVVAGRDGTSAPEPAPAPDVPSVGYAVDGVYHRADGSTVELPTGTWDTVTELDGGLVLTSEDHSAYAQELDADGGLVAQWCTRSLPVAWGTTVAWTENSCSHHRRQVAIVVDGPAGRIRHPMSSDAELTGVDDDGNVVYFDGSDARLLSADGTDRTIPGFDFPTDYDPVHGRVSGQLEGPDVTGGVTDLDGTVLWRRRGLSAGFFSPDGDRLLAREAGGDNQSLVVSTTNGREVRRLPTTPGVTAFVWDDGDVVEVPVPAGADQADVVWQTLP